MQEIKKQQAVSSTTRLPSQKTEKKRVDPAYEAGLAKVDFYRTDKWEDGSDAKKTYVVPKNTLPLPFAKAFLPSPKTEPVTGNLGYDQNLFVIDEYPIYADPKGLGGAQVWSQKMGPVADIWFDTDTFVIKLREPPTSGMFPFTADALLKAIHAAKWDIELYVLPKPWEADDEATKKPKKP